jgi:peptidoglycan-N-acetylmuramic acid deacetylase
MKIRKILLSAAVLILLSGCSQAAVNYNTDIISAPAGSVDSQDDSVKDETYADSKQKTKTDTPEPASNNSGEKTQAAKLQPADTGTQDAEPAKEYKLDFMALDKLDNTKYAWGLNLNDEHKTPGIPSDAKQMLEKYGGIYLGDTSRKTVYLTFDEGYENGYTAKILDTLKENDVKALFFVTGPYIRKNSDLVKRMLDEGHEVGNHTINHPSLPETDNPSLEEELYGLDMQFSDKFGRRFKYMRPPMGEYSEKVLEAARQLGYKTVFWSFTYRDFDVNNQKGADYAFKKVMDNLHNGAVILLHAVSRDNAEALDKIIKEIKAQGYSISSFDL